MDNVFMIHLDDYIRHIDEKLELYAMLRQLEDAIGKLPECRSTAEARRCMAAFSPKLKELGTSPGAISSAGSRRTLAISARAATSAPVRTRRLCLSWSAMSCCWG